MNLIYHNMLNKLGKRLAIPLSFIVSTPLTYKFFNILKIYLALLLGQGSGIGWAIKAEAKAAYGIIKNLPQREHPIIFDVGANKGVWSLLLSKYVQEENLIFLSRNLRVIL